MGYAATITKTGQITVPKWVREALGVKSGDRVIFRKEKQAVMIERERTTSELAEEIGALIPDQIRQAYINEYGGMTAAAAREKWAKSPEGKAYFEKELKKCL